MSTPRAAKPFENISNISRDGCECCRRSPFPYRTADAEKDGCGPAYREKLGYQLRIRNNDAHAEGCDRSYFVKDRAARQRIHLIADTAARPVLDQAARREVDHARIAYFEALRIVTDVSPPIAIAASDDDLNLEDVAGDVDLEELPRPSDLDGSPDDLFVLDTVFTPPTSPSRDDVPVVTPATSLESSSTGEHAHWPPPESMVPTKNTVDDGAAARPSSLSAFCETLYTFEDAMGPDAREGISMHWSPVLGAPNGGDEADDDGARTIQTSSDDDAHMLDDNDFDGAFPGALGCEPRSVCVDNPSAQNVALRVSLPGRRTIEPWQAMHPPVLFLHVREVPDREPEPVYPEGRRALSGGTTLEFRFDAAQRFGDLFGSCAALRATNVANLDLTLRLTDGETYKTDTPVVAYRQSYVPTSGFMHV